MVLHSSDSLEYWQDEESSLSSSLSIQKSWEILQVSYVGTSTNPEMSLCPQSSHNFISIHDHVRFHCSIFQDMSQDELSVIFTKIMGYACHSFVIISQYQSTET